jgi:hypothetical protein
MLHRSSSCAFDMAIAIGEAQLYPVGVGIDVQRAGPIRPWPARVGSGRPAMAATGYEPHGPDHLRARATPSDRATSHFIGPQITRAAFDRATGLSAQYQNKSQINLTRSNMMMKT